jgi:predicted small secreted protein
MDFKNENDFLDYCKIELEANHSLRNLQRLKMIAETELYTMDKNKIVSIYDNISKKESPMNESIIPNAFFQLLNPFERKVYLNVSQKVSSFKEEDYKQYLYYESFLKNKADIYLDGYEIEEARRQAVLESSTFALKLFLLLKKNNVSLLTTQNDEIEKFISFEKDKMLKIHDNYNNTVKFILSSYIYCTPALMPYKDFKRLRDVEYNTGVDFITLFLNYALGKNLNNIKFEFESFRKTQIGVEKK